MLPSDLRPRALRRVVSAALISLPFACSNGTGDRAAESDEGGGGVGGSGLGGGGEAVGGAGGIAASAGGAVGSVGGVGGGASGSAGEADGPAGAAGGSSAGAGGSASGSGGEPGGTSNGGAENPDAGADGFAGSADAGPAAPVGDALFVPADVAVTNLSGEGQAVNVVASTLRAGPDGPKFYAALENSGEVTGCDAAVSFELFDHDGVSVGAWVAGLYTGQLFRRDDGEDGLVACIAPGGKAMVALTDLPEDLAIDDIGAALYQLTYFDRDILPFELIPVELAVTGVTSIDSGESSAFSGTVENGLDVEVANPAVIVFALNGVGRPLGAASSNSTTPISPGGSWMFETSTLDDVGETAVAYPSGAVSF